MSEESRLAAVRYLERVQEAAFVQAGTSAAAQNEWFHANHQASAPTAFISVAPDHPGPPEVWAAEIWRDRVEHTRAGGASRFELIPTFAILLDRLLEIFLGADRLGLPRPRPFIFGTLYVPRVNAEALVPPESDHAVLIFDGDLFTFCLLFAKSIVDAGLITIDGTTIQISDAPSIAYRVAGNRELQAAFTAALEGYVLSGTPAHAPQYFIQPEYANAARILWEGMERFVVAHEYQHLLAGHLNAAHPRAALLAGQRVATFVPRQADEFEADRLALPLALAASDDLGINVDLGFLAADLLLLCLDIADRGWSMVAVGDDTHRPRAKTHPSAGARRAAVREEMHRLYPESSDDSVWLADTVGHAAELLWAEVKPTFRRHFVLGADIKRFKGTTPVG